MCLPFLKAKMPRSVNIHPEVNSLLKTGEFTRGRGKLDKKTFYLINPWQPRGYGKIRIKHREKNTKLVMTIDPFPNINNQERAFIALHGECASDTGYQSLGLHEGTHDELIEKGKLALPIWIERNKHLIKEKQLTIF